MIRLKGMAIRPIGLGKEGYKYILVLWIICVALRRDPDWD